VATTGGVLICAMLIVIDATERWPLAALAVLVMGTGFYMLHNTLQTNATQMAPEKRGTAVSQFAFCLFVGQSVGAAVFGAILNFGVYRLLPNAGDAVNRLMSPAARQSLAASEIARLTEAVGSSLHVVYVIAGLVALISLILALALPARLSPTSSSFCQSKQPP